MFYRKARNPISFLTHFIGMLLSYLGFIILIIMGFYKSINNEIFIGCIVYCLSLIVLYGASSKYHYSVETEKIITKLRKWDHSMIFVLIAGSYTPIVITYLSQPYKYYFLGIIWFIAFFGVILKILWINMPRILSTILYVFLGCSILLYPSLLLSVSFISLKYIIVSGIFYIVGAIIYAIKKPQISYYFGFHELFHIFIMLGSFFHYLAVLKIFI